jgi:hypothetical protein
VTNTALFKKITSISRYNSAIFNQENEILFQVRKTALVESKINLKSGVFSEPSGNQSISGASLHRYLLQ